MAPPPGSLPIAPREIARLAHCGPVAPWEKEILAGIDEARSLIDPRVRWSAFSKEHLDGLFPGQTPVEEIARCGERWGFVATIGSPLEERVKEHLGAGEYLRGVLLDAAGSVAVEAICDIAERTCAGEGASSRYSPGYCMWPLSGQSRLFALLHPEKIGVELLPSMLMHPLKSVSGIIVKAGAEKLTVPAEACEQCDSKGCTRRSARHQGG